MRSYPCSTLVLGLWPETDSELSASEGTTARNLHTHTHTHVVLTVFGCE